MSRLVLAWKRFLFWKTSRQNQQTPLKTIHGCVDKSCMNGKSFLKDNSWIYRVNSFGYRGTSGVSPPPRDQIFLDFMGVSGNLVKYRIIAPGGIMDSFVVELKLLEKYIYVKGKIYLCQSSKILEIVIGALRLCLWCLKICYKKVFQQEPYCPLDNTCFSSQPPDVSTKGSSSKQVWTGL